MKKLITFLTILFLAAIPTVSFAATYYSLGAANINAADAWCSDTSATCSTGTKKTFGTDGFPESGAVLDANSYAMNVNVDPGPNGTVSLDTTTNGGGFTVTGATLTLHCNVGLAAQTGNTTVLTINTTGHTVLGNIYGGDTANATGLTITGASVATVIGASGAYVTIKGGSASGTYGVSDAHTGAGVASTVYANPSGGTSGRGYYFNGSSGTVSILGTCTGVGASGCYMANNGIMTVNNCTGSSTTVQMSGCINSGATNAMVVTGNIIAGTRAIGADGYFHFTPASVTNYISVLTTADATFEARSPAKADVKTGVQYGTQTGEYGGGGSSAYAY